MAYCHATPLPWPKYNTAQYPYEIMLFNYNVGENAWYHAIFVASTAPFKASHISIDDGEGNILCSGTAVRNTGEVLRWICGTDMVWEQQESGDIAFIPGLYGGVYSRIWTLKGIRDQDGNLWLDGGHATPVETTDGYKNWQEVFELGLSIGLNLHELQLGGYSDGSDGSDQEMYSYNGMILPDINTIWKGSIKTRYPYVYVYKHVPQYTGDREEEYRLITTDKQLYWYSPWNMLTADKNGAPIEFNLYWAYFNPNTDQDWVVAGAVQDTDISPTDGSFWSNYDTYDNQDNIYIATSDPVPV